MFSNRAELRGNSADLETSLWNIQGAHAGLEQKIWVRSQKAMQTEDRCWKDVVLSDSEELCPQVVERETYEEKSAESAGFLVSRWKKERYFVLCGKDQNIQSPATSHQSPVHVFLGKKCPGREIFFPLGEFILLLLYGLNVKCPPEVSCVEALTTER